MALKIKMGGLIRWPFDVTTSETWKPGNLVILDQATLKLKLVSSADNTDVVVGAVIENKQTTTDLTNVEGSGFTADQTKGSGKASLVLSPAVMEVDQLVSGMEYKAGQRLYTTSAGLWTKTASTDGRVLGQALENLANGGASGATLLILYDPALFKQG
jgi:hypothetical protein